jgi:MFS family permease
MYFGSAIAQMGTWMRMIVLVAWAYDVTKSAAFVGQITFATLCPVLILGIAGGVLADRVDRRKLLMVLLGAQAAICILLALVVRADSPSRLAILALSFALGLCTAVQQPVYTAILPNLVGPDELPTVISLQSVMTNSSRIVGPALAGVMFAALGASWVLLLSAASLGLSVLAVLGVRLPARVSVSHDSVRESLATTFRVARDDRVVRRTLVTITIFSSFSLLFVNQMPVVASQNLGVAPKSTAYAIFYAAFGVGAVIGSLGCGTVLARLSPTVVVRWGLVGFGAALTWLGLSRTPLMGTVAALVVGVTYMAMTTALTTAFQVRLDDTNRGKLTAIWMMGYAGCVALSNIALGPVVDAVEMPPVLIFGAIVAALLAVYANLSDGVTVPAVVPSPVGTA